MILKILFFILCLNVIKNERFNDEHCHKNLVESYNLNSYLKPRSIQMYICPKIQLSCCSIYDQFLMFTNWRDNISKNLKRYYTGIFKKTIVLYKLLKYFERMKITIMMGKMNISKIIKNKIKDLLFLIKSNKLVSNVRKLLGFQKKSNAFMLRMKSTFYCSICDYDSHEFFDEDEKVVQINASSCAKIVKGTLAHAYFLNMKVLPDLFRFSKLISYFNPDDVRPPTRLKGYRKIRSDIMKCSKVKGGDIRPCYNYCKYYRFNSNSPVLEGYQTFINEILMDIKIFIKHNKTTRPKKRRKSPAGRFLMQQKNSFAPFKFNSKYFVKRPDIYTEKHQDPEFNDTTINKMTNWNNQYDKQKNINYVNFIKNKLHFFDIDYDYENPDRDEIFNTAAKNVVDLENFETSVKVHGINLVKHLKSTNIGRSLKDLLGHLKSKSKYKIYFEKIDHEIVHQVNDISNKEVKTFHQDNFLGFKNFGGAMIKGNIKRN